MSSRCGHAFCFVVEYSIGQISLTIIQKNVIEQIFVKTK